MKAATYTHYGPPEHLRVTDIAKPVPKDNEVLISVEAASVNPLDWHVMRGKPLLVRLMGFGLFKPKVQILGADIAGRVEAVGKDVTRFKVGDEVFGSGRAGFAEYVCRREDRLALKPVKATFEQAAGVPIAALTALQGLRDHGRLRSGHRVLINGASGGVGSFAVQIAKALGAHVTGVCSGKNAEMVRAIGADEVIDYEREQYWKRGEQYDLILDNAASCSIRKSRRVLSANGIHVLVGGSMATFLESLLLGPVYSRKKGKKIASFVASLNQTDLMFLSELLETGKIVPVIERRFSLCDVAQAVAFVEQGHTRGKVIIAIRS